MEGPPRGSLLWSKDYYFPPLTLNHEFIARTYFCNCIITRALVNLSKTGSSNLWSAGCSRHATDDICRKTRTGRAQCKRGYECLVYMFPLLIHLSAGIISEILISLD